MTALLTGLFAMTLFFGVAYLLGSLSQKGNKQASHSDKMVDGLTLMPLLVLFLFVCWAIGSIILIFF